MVVFDNLGLVCGFLTWGEGGFHGFFNFGIWYATSLWGKNAKVRVFKLNLCLKHNMVFSFGFVLFKFSFVFSLVLVFRVYYFSSPFFSFHIYFYIFH
jgi:hypothetical protein